MYRRNVVAMAAAATVFAVTPAIGQEIKIGLSAEPSAIDPHYHVYTPNESLRQHIFEALTGFDVNRNIVPILAESWKPVNSTTWEFKLRNNVKFSDGTPFTAQDVIYSLCRVSKVPNSPSSYAISTRHIANAKAGDARTVIIETSSSYALLPNDLAKVGIISAKVNGGENVQYNKDGCEAPSWPATKDFNNGKLAIGTGPYRYGEYVPGSRVVLNRNDQYWGTKPAWAKVTFRPIPSDGPRVAALLSGDVDLIESVPVQDVERVKSNARFTIHTARSARLIYIGLDSVSVVNASVTGETKNPFKDKRVREAVSRAIDRPAIVEKIMGRYAVPAWQFVYGNGDTKVNGWYNPAKAKELLAQAGYPNGFELTLAGPNDRYVNDEQIVQAVAQMLSAVGIKTKVNVMTSNVFFPRQSKGEFGFRLSAWQAATGEISYPMRALVATPNKEKGNGTANYNKYSNPAVDALLEQAVETLDNGQRQQLLQKASDLAIDDIAILPLHYEVSIWAMRKGIDFPGRWDQVTKVSEITASK